MEYMQIYSLHGKRSTVYLKSGLPGKHEVYRPGKRCMYLEKVFYLENKWSTWKKWSMWKQEVYLENMSFTLKTGGLP